MPEAWSGHEACVRELCSRFEMVDILELGGGRSPLFDLDTLPHNVTSYTVNDIDPKELAMVPSGYSTACFDVGGDVRTYAGRYDLVISKMLAEHVADGRQMHVNVRQLLKNGGIAFHFCPKLYSLPFLLNLFLPERLSRRFLFAFFPQRRREVPKFPAVYSWCRGSASRMKAKIAALGYSEVTVVPFYGHGYYDPIPGLKQLELLTRRLARAAGLSLIAPYVYVIARK